MGHCWSLTSVAVLLGIATLTTPPNAYASVPLARIVNRPAAFVGHRILTTGRFAVRVHSTFSVDGWLEEQGARLRIVGPVFDWQPAPGQLIDVWGLLRRDTAASGFYLDFFNGRPANNHNRAPRRTPVFVPGQTLWVIGRVRQVGSAPVIHWVLQLEDRSEVDLADFPPAGREAIAGALIEVHGKVKAGALPPALATLEVLGVRPVPGAPPRPFGG
jgi:hypothetical protein